MIFTYLWLVARLPNNHNVHNLMGYHVILVTGDYFEILNSYIFFIMVLKVAWKSIGEGVKEPWGYIFI